MLLRMRESADREGCCLDYYGALSHAVHSASKCLGPSNLEQLHTLFLSELSKVSQLHTQPPSSPCRSSSAPSASDDQRLTGHLCLLSSLWLVLTEHQSTAAAEIKSALNSAATVELLLDHLLFPEASLCVRTRFNPDVIMQLSVAELQAALSPACCSAMSRAAAYDLLKAIILTRDDLMAVCLRKLLSMLGPGPMVAGVLQQQFAQHHDPRLGCAGVSTRWRGLKSTGATCYMNAVLQQLFCQPTIRAMVLRAAEVQSMEEEKDAVFAAVQLTFANLAVSTARHFTPSLMWDSLRDRETGQPINIMVRYILQHGINDSTCTARVISAHVPCALHRGHSPALQ
jgi:hypothetical protein